MESHCIATKKVRCKSSKRTFDRVYKMIKKQVTLLLKYLSYTKSMQDIFDRLVEAKSNLQNEKMFSEFQLKFESFLEFHKYVFTF